MRVGCGELHWDPRLRTCASAGRTSATSNTFNKFVISETPIDIERCGARSNDQQGGVGERRNPEPEVWLRTMERLGCPPQPPSQGAQRAAIGVTLRSRRLTSVAAVVGTLDAARPLRPRYGTAWPPRRCPWRVAGRFASNGRRSGVRDRSLRRTAAESS